MPYRNCNSTPSTLGADIIRIIPDFPIGLTIQNNTTTPCNTPATFTYGPNCFDQLNIIAIDSTTPPAHPSDSGSNCVSTTSSILFANPVSPTTNAQLAADYHNGDEVLVVKVGWLAYDHRDAYQRCAGHRRKSSNCSTIRQSMTERTPRTPPASPRTRTTNLARVFCPADWILRNFADHLQGGYFHSIGPETDSRAAQRQHQRRGSRGTGDRFQGGCDHLEFLHRIVRCRRWIHLYFRRLHLHQRRRFAGLQLFSHPQRSN